MRITALSDIHGNRCAPEAILADIATRGVDVTVNLGDILSGAAAALGHRRGADAASRPTVRGNHERPPLPRDVAP